MHLNPLTSLFSQGNLIKCLLRKKNHPHWNLRPASRLSMQKHVNIDCVWMVMFMDFISLVEESHFALCRFSGVHSPLNKSLKHVHQHIHHGIGERERERTIWLRRDHLVCNEMYRTSFSFENASTLNLCFASVSIRKVASCWFYRERRIHGVW